MVSYDNAELNVEETNIRVVKLLSEQELSISDQKIFVHPDAGFILEIIDIELRISSVFNHTNL